MAPSQVTLDDKYEKRDGRVFLTGIHALVRLPMVQRQRDKAAGLDTAGFISGYRGSPLGVYDQELTRAKRFLDAHDVRFEPGINEDLAATAVWGTQQLHLSDKATKDGVFGIWYGKGPGVDRSMDVLKHANAAGSAPFGGVLALGGDDHGAKSSTLPHQSDHNFMAAFMPLLYPSGVHEFVEYGLLGLAMSRYSGCWIGFKAVTDTVESSATVDLAREAREIILPEDFDMPEGGVSIRWPDAWREQDRRLQRYKGFAAIAFARANKIDKVIWDSPNPRFGIISSGKSYQDVRQALYELGIDEERASEIGLRLYKVGMPWPLEPEGARHFCEGLEEVLVVEEKREMIEHQLKWQLFNWREEVRPTVVGKHDENDQWLLPPENELTVGLIAHVIAERLARHYESETIRTKLDYFRAREIKLADFTAPIDRTPYFCSGCPHNTSTKVPEGSRATAGIGCHIMAMNMDRNTETFTQMGGEGAPWIGQACFTEEEHIFVNLGDGTYQHSGLLAIRAAVSAGVNVTYKILYNDAVAMTGGQAVDGGLTVEDIVRQTLAEGVKNVSVVAEDPSRFAAGALPKEATLYDRAEFDNLQKRYRELPGCSVIVFDQTCAAEKRRRRKRGLMEEPDQRIFINAAVCEGCGDCSIQSNCLSVEPLETEFGRKRTINQSTCNKDYSCLKGFCPSFVTVEGGELRSIGVDSDFSKLGNLPAPKLASLDHDYNILVTGIGGTGVLTIGALLGMAAHLEGKECLVADMTGLAQKGGAVMSHVRIGESLDTLRSPRIVTGGADLLLACDSVVAASASAADILSPERTTAIVNTDLTPVSDFIRRKNINFQDTAIRKTIRDNARGGEVWEIPAAHVAQAVTGDSIMTNITMLGYAVQKGMIPLGLAAIKEAIRLNGVAVERNILALNLGRALAHDEGFAEGVLKQRRGEIETLSETLEEVIERRARRLTNYQGKAYAKRYMSLVDRVRVADEVDGRTEFRLTEAVARNYAKLLAYKDEYEVARLYTNGEFAAAIERQFTGDPSFKIHLSPPFMSGIDPATGRPKKRAFGPWVMKLFKLLASLRWLRGTPLDPFGYAPERKMERALISAYEDRIKWLLHDLRDQNYELAIEIAGVPDMIRGFGPVKDENIEKAKARDEELAAQYSGGTPSESRAA